MNRDRVVNIITSPYWLLITLGAVFFCYFGVNRGAADTWAQICGFFVILNIAFKKYEWKQLFSPFLIFAVGVFFSLIFFSLIFSYDLSHGRLISNLREMMLVVIGMDCLYNRITNYSVLYYFSLVVIVVSAAIHIIHFYPSSESYIRATNRNVLANFLLVLIPSLAFFGATIKPRKWLLLLLPLLILCIDMLLKSHSRPAILGLIGFGAVFLPFFTNGKHRIVYLSCLVLLVGIILFSNYADLSTRFIELESHITKEERVFIWSDTLRMIFSGNWGELTVGHGIGSFRYLFAHYSSIPRYARFPFPHNLFLQIMYESGIIGVIMVLALLGTIFFILVKMIRANISHTSVVFCKCLLLYYCSWLFHSGLTVGFFSKYTMYPLAFTLGCANIFYLYMKNRSAWGSESVQEAKTEGKTP